MSKEHRSNTEPGSLTSGKSKYQKFGKGIAIIFFGCSLILILGMPPFGAYQKGTPDSETKNNLHNLFLACKAYWADKGGDKNCTVDIAKQDTYGYIQSSDVSVSGNGTATTFIARGQHAKSNKSYIMNTIGDVIRE